MDAAEQTTEEAARRERRARRLARVWARAGLPGPPPDAEELARNRAADDAAHTGRMQRH